LEAGNSCLLFVLFWVVVGEMEDLVGLFLHVDFRRQL
jgi:hypothetical protein